MFRWFGKPFRHLGRCLMYSFSILHVHMWLLSNTKITVGGKFCKCFLSHFDIKNLWILGSCDLLFNIWPFPVYFQNGKGRSNNSTLPGESLETKNRYVILAYSYSCTLIITNAWFTVDTFLQNGQKKKFTLKKQASLFFASRTRNAIASSLMNEPCIIRWNSLLSPAGAVGPGTGDIATPPVRPSVCPSVCLSVRLSVTFSFRTVTQKRIAVFSRNFAGTCTKWWGCAV